MFVGEETKIISITVTVRSAVLCMGTMGNWTVVPQANEPHANLCMLYTHNFLFSCYVQPIHVHEV
jgi:hypothetical protein